MTRFALLLCAGLLARAQDFKALEQRVTDFTLANGFRFVVAERHDAPVISFITHVPAGTSSDSPGLTGLAEFFGRLAFKGTETIGTRDGAAEKKALDALEEAQNRLDAERAKGRLANDIDIVRLEMEIHKAANLAQSFVVPLEFQHILEENSATGVLARVSADGMQVHMVLPSNRAELWFVLEAQRISRPVFRDFYRERDEAIPDFRNRVELSPQTKLLQTLAAAAFSAHPYRNPTFGWPGEFAQLRHGDARQFFQRNFVPGNIVLGISGDILPEEARRLAEKHFGSIPARPRPPLPRIQEPPQTGPRTVVIENSVEPLLGIGFKRPDQLDRDDTVLEVTRSLLAGGRSSMLGRELVETRRIASNVTIFSTYPGGRSPHLFTIVVSPLPGHTAEENEKAVLAVLARLQAEAVDEAALARAKSQARANLARRFSDNSSIASTLAHHASEFEDWRRILVNAEQFKNVTAAQVQVAATKYFIPSRQTTVLMVQPAPVRSGAPKGAAQ